MKNTASDIKQHLFEHPLTAGLIIFSVMSTLLLSTSPPAHSLPQDGMTHQRVAPQVQVIRPQENLSRSKAVLQTPNHPRNNDA